MEPYRFLADTTVIECLEYDRFSQKDFYRLDNYVLRLKPEAVKKLLGALRIKFNSPVRYKSKLFGWDVIVRMKVHELAAFLLDKRSTISFEQPQPTLNDDSAIRKAVLSLSVGDARKLGIRRNTLWYAQKRAKSNSRLRVYQKVESKISSS